MPCFGKVSTAINSFFLLSSGRYVWHKCKKKYTQKCHLTWFWSKLIWRLITLVKLKVTGSSFFVCFRTFVHCRPLTTFWNTFSSATSYDNWTTEASDWIWVLYTSIHSSWWNSYFTALIQDIPQQIVVRCGVNDSGLKALHSVTSLVDDTWIIGFSDFNVDEISACLLFCFHVRPLFYKSTFISWLTVLLSLVNDNAVGGRSTFHTGEIKMCMLCTFCLTHSLCLSVSNSKACSLAERSGRLCGKDSSLWSPDLSGSSRISIWPRILNMHTETEHTEGLTWVPEMGVKKILTVMTSLMSNHPCLSPLTNENYINLLIMCMCDMEYCVYSCSLICSTYMKDHSSSQCL